jgi:hypothetical protein
MTANKHITVCSLEDAAHSVELSDYMEENGISDVSDFLTGTEADKLQIDGNIILFARVEMPINDADYQNQHAVKLTFEPVNKQIWTSGKNYRQK